eukprot:798405-Amphidinium_carterae.2
MEAPAEASCTGQNSNMLPARHPWLLRDCRLCDASPLCARRLQRMSVVCASRQCKHAAAAGGMCNMKSVQGSGDAVYGIEWDCWHWQPCVTSANGANIESTA